MSQHPVYTNIGALPKSSTNKIRAMTWHETQNAEALNAQLEALAEALFSRGGLVRAGTQLLETDSIRVQNYLGVAWDGLAAVYIPDDTVSTAGLPAGKHLVVALATPVHIQYTYTDPETSETIHHDMSARLGVLSIIQGTSTDYPAVPSIAAPVAYLDTTGSPALSPYDKPPEYRGTNSGATANRPSSPPTGAMYFDTDLGKPIWWNGSAWVDATGGSV